MGTLEVSQRRIDANRRNALLSTGPTSAEGKETSRRNSLIHGLAGAGVVMPSAESEAIRGRIERWEASACPADAFEQVLVETVAVESVRVDRCRIEERLVRQLRGMRATHCWGDERRADVECVARGLADRPSELSARLGLSAPGCDWLIERWRSLGSALDQNGGWTEAQLSRALDLLGIAPDRRDQDDLFDIPEGVGLIEFLRALVDERVELLMARKAEALDAIEDELREATMHGLSVVEDRTLTLIRRYETASMRRMRWAIDLLNQALPAPESATNCVTPDSTTTSSPTPASAPGKIVGAERTHSAERRGEIPRFVDAFSAPVHDFEAIGPAGRPDVERAAAPAESARTSRRKKNSRKALRQSRRRRGVAPVLVTAC
jgi:hypothetical protein